MRPALPKKPDNHVTPLPREFVNLLALNSLEPRPSVYGDYWLVCDGTEANSPVLFTVNATDSFERLHKWINSSLWVRGG